MNKYYYSDTLQKGGKSWQRIKRKYLEEIEDQIRTIGVLTSGGDAPGMNAAIDAVVRTALSRD